MVEALAAGRRLDVFLSSLLPHLSRARIQALIAGGHVAIEGPRRPAQDPRIRGGGAVAARPRPAHRVVAGERIEVVIPAARPARLLPEHVPLSVVYEDGELLVVDKPPGLAVHPGAGRQTGTLVHALIAHCPDLPGIGGEQRPGIVHRLDKDTSGLLLVAKTEASLRALQAQIQVRTARRDYLALVHGRVARDEGTVDAPIGRDPRRRTRMAVVASGRRAVTNYRVAERFPDATLLEIRLGTGRTHQIRVHCASLGHPVVGDRVYGRGANPWGLRRQALHAFRLTFAHPVSGAEMTLTAPLPRDMAAALEALRAISREKATRA